MVERPESVAPWRPHRSSGLTRLAMVATDLLNNWHNLVSRRGALMRLSKLPRALFPLMCCLATFVFLVVMTSTNFVAAQSRQASTETSLDAMPRYATNRNLVVPDDYRRWVLVGSSLGLSYSEGRQGGHQMFNSTLMEPSAYRHFIEKGTFREGTMFAL